MPVQRNEIEHHIIEKTDEAIDCMQLVLLEAELLLENLKSPAFRVGSPALTSESVMRVRRITRCAKKSGETLHAIRKLSYFSESKAGGTQSLPDSESVKRKLSIKQRTRGI
ncbi:MAG: hypothetical protein ACYC7D_04455 [Nitrososphaerales archaeon]